MLDVGLIRPSATFVARGGCFCFIYCDLIDVEGRSLQQSLRYIVECQLVDVHAAGAGCRVPGAVALLCCRHRSTVRCRPVLRWAVWSARQGCWSTPTIAALRLTRHLFSPVCRHFLTHTVCVRSWKPVVHQPSPTCWISYIANEDSCRIASVTHCLRTTSWSRDYGTATFVSCHSEIPRHIGTAIWSLLIGRYSKSTCPELFTSSTDTANEFTNQLVIAVTSIFSIFSIFSTSTVWYKNGVSLRLTGGEGGVDGCQVLPSKLNVSVEDWNGSGSHHVVLMITLSIGTHVYIYIYIYIYRSDNKSNTSSLDKNSTDNGSMQ